MDLPLPPAKILIVDDKAQNLFALQKLLEKLPVEVIQTTSGEKALGLTLEHDFALAIVDVQMPEMDGYELVDLWRSTTKTKTLPVIFVSAIYSDEYHHRKGYEAGAVDFLSKPFIPEILLSKIKVFLDLYNQRLQLQMLVNQVNRTNQTLFQRTMQLETSNQVGRQVTSILHQDELLTAVVTLIREKFGYYFTGIWLWNDEGGVTLQAGVGGDNTRPLPIEFTIARTDKSVILTTCRTGQPYLANDVQTDENYFGVAELPLTASELALPLQFRTQLIGVLDIQSTQTHAFAPEDITALQTLADQIAIAIRNAQLYATIVGFNEELEEKVQERTAELQNAYQRLELLDRNKSEFIGVVSHELRTPLTLIKGFSQMLLTDPIIRENDYFQSQILGISTGADRMHDIVNSMLDMVKIDSRALALSLESVALTAIFQNLRGSLAQVLLERKLNLVLEDMTTLPIIEADENALEKLFNHLLLNAIKYTPDGGNITVSGKFLGTPDSRPSDCFIELVVSDTGIGIAPEFQELIFTKFYQTGKVTFHSSGKTKFKGGGPGLGLAIARGIAEAHGGRIWVESPGYDEETCPGSAFHVVLPVVVTSQPNGHL